MFSGVKSACVLRFGFEKWRVNMNPGADNGGVCRTESADERGKFARQRVRAGSSGDFAVLISAQGCERPVMRRRLGFVPI